ncbi:MAG: lamin tail domain-containing protein [Planctomycetales bacterium]|nr:lamin tail domain-containing protein [Planctomycetales bacterium]
MKRRRAYVSHYSKRATTERLESRILLAADLVGDTDSIVINELHVNPDIDTELVEFIELHNTTDEPRSVSGWYFDGGVSYSFPKDASIEPHGYYVITQNAEHFSTKFGRGADGQFEGKLSNEGETIVLRDANNLEVDRVDYGLGFPWPTVGDEPGYSMELVNPKFDNQLGGSWRSSVGNQTVFAYGAEWKLMKGTQEPDAAWNTNEFNDADWQTVTSPIGFGRTAVVSTELDDMRSNYSTFYVRKSFFIADPANVSDFAFESIFDDGLNVWINGTHVLSQNVESATVPFDGLATGSGSTRSSELFTFENAAQYLVAGNNTIAVQVLNSTLSGSDAMFEASLANTALRAPGPTPGESNSIFSDALGPQLRQVSHTPAQPKSTEDVTIQIKATDDDGIDSLSLEYQIVAPGDYIRLTDSRFVSDWTSVPMRDDGQGGDLTAGDSIYTAVISADLHTHRHLMRYRINAIDKTGMSSVAPYDDDPQPNFAYFVYDGIPSWTGADRPGSSDAVTFGPDVMNQLATYHLIADADDVQSSQYRSASEEVRFRGTMVYGDKVYDHIEFRIRGEFSTYVAGKNKWKFFFNRGHEFQADDNYGQPFQETRRVLNFSAAATPWMPMNRGMAGIGEAIAYRLYDLAGVPSPDTNFVQFRVIDDATESPEDQYEGDLWGLYLSLEHPDGRFLNERGLPDGTTFKMEGGSGQGDIKNQGPTQPDAARTLRTFMNAALRSNEEQFWRDNVDLDAYYSFRSVNREVNNMDIRDGWNHYLYHNPETNKFTVIPWDLDMLYIPTTHWSGVIRLENLLREDNLEIEYMNRGRELQDLLFNEEQIGILVDEYAGFVNPQNGQMTMVDVDQFMWNYNPRTAGNHRGAFNRQRANFDSRGGGGRRTLVSGDHEGFAQWVKDFLLPEPGGGSDPTAYGWNFLNRESKDDDIPATPTLTHSVGDVVELSIDQMQFNVSAFSDPQGNGTFGKIEWRLAEVTDPNSPTYDPAAPLIYEVESVWESGEQDTFASSISIPSVAAEPGHAYRARVRVFDNTGRASHWSQPLHFVATPAESTDLADKLRVTEVHYHPADPTAAEVAAGFTDKNDFEFIEVMNISSETIDVSDAEFVQVDVDGESEGIGFQFAAGSVTELSPGQRVVVVENAAAFAARYGSEIDVAGEWSGRLSNSGETITLQAAGVQIQQFRYSDDWHTSTDGEGRSLEIANPNGATNTWNIAGSWQPSSSLGGTPGSSPRILGDVNNDGVFDSSDLVAVFAAGEYEDGIAGNSSYETGDWNGDGDFDTRDFVFVFTAGTYSRLAKPLSAQNVDLFFVREQRSHKASFDELIGNRRSNVVV